MEALICLSGLAIALFAIFGIIVSPDGQPYIRLSYILRDEDGEIVKSKVEQVQLHRAIKHPVSLVFDIQYLNTSEEIEYNLQDDIIVGNDSFTMVRFELLKLEGETDFIYVGTIVKTDLVEGSLNIKVSGMLPYEPQYQYFPYTAVPKL